MIPWRSIEFRLTGWYSLLLLAGLLSLGVVLWFGVNYSMVAAVDDLLAARVDHLIDLVESEFGEEEPGLRDGDTEREFRGSVEKIDPAGPSFVVGGVAVDFDSGTVFESDRGAFGPEHLREGQPVEVVAEKRTDRWHAREVALKTGLLEELREELNEYAIAVPDGSLIQVRNETGELLVPAGSRLASSLVLPWQTPPAEGRNFQTIEAAGGIYRVLTQRTSLAGLPCQLLVATSLASVAATRDRLVSWLWWVIPTGLLLSFAGGYAISRSALRPVEHITNLASRTDVRHLSERLDVPASGDVLERLAVTFNEMLGRIESSVRRLEQFTADASHELRTPISVVRTTAELALRQGRTEEQWKRDMAAIQEEAARLTELIEDLLTLARADSGAASLPMADVDLAPLTRDACRPFRAVAEKKGVNLLVNPATAPAPVRGHEASLRQLLIILIENALEHTSSGDSISVTLDGNHTYIELAVADTGEGIPEEKLARIFDRFYRADASRSRAGGRFGLGLSIAKWIVESHGGQITVASKPGHGSSFTTTFTRAHGKARAG